MRGLRSTPWLLVATLTAAGAAAAAGYGLTAPKRYQATAQLLVAPVSAGDSTFAGLDVLRSITGKPGAAQTAALLVRSPQVADTVRTELGVRRSVSSLLGDVRSHAVGASDIVDVSVEDSSATTAAQLANAFVDALIAQRTTTFQSQLASAIHRDALLLAGGSAGPQAIELARRLAVLRSFQGQPDPTVRRASSAVAPTSASWPVLWSLILIGAGIGLALGAIAFLVLTVLRRRRPGDVIPSQYDRGMSDRAVTALVDRLEQRLAARESALAVRERELQAKIDELRAIEARDDSSQALPDALRAKEQELEERERQLAERVAAVQQRELAAARAHAAAANDGEKPASDDFAERERALEARIAAVQQRELAVARSASKELELLERERALQEREQRLELARDTSSQARPREPEVTGAFNLATIEQLVERRGGDFPERRDEWESTVYFLRDYAAADGTLPGSFDWLVQDTFAPLLD